MTAMGKAAVLFAMAAALSGCKAVQVTFINPTSEALDVKVHGPGFNCGRLGMVPGDGEIRTEILVCPCHLPRTYTFTAVRHTDTPVAGSSASQYSGKFTIACDSKGRIWVPITSPALSDPEYRHPEGYSKTGCCSRVVYYPQNP